MNISHKVLRKYIYFQEMLHIVPLIEFRFSYQHTSMGAQILAPRKRKYAFIYSDIFYRWLCFFLLDLGKVCTQIRKHTLPIWNLI